MDQLPDQTPKPGAHGSPTTPVQFMGRPSLTSSNNAQVPVKIFFALKKKSVMTIDVLRNSLMLKKKSTDRSIVECIEMRATNFTDDKLSNFFFDGKYDPK
jgi:hypothetical protein